MRANVTVGGRKDMTIESALEMTLCLPSNTYKIQWIEENNDWAIRILWNGKLIAYGVRGNVAGALISQKVVLETVDKICADIKDHVVKALKIDANQE